MARVRHVYISEILRTGKAWQKASETLRVISLRMVWLSDDWCCHRSHCDGTRQLRSRPRKKRRPIDWLDFTWEAHDLRWGLVLEALLRLIYCSAVSFRPTRLRDAWPAFGLTPRSPTLGRFMLMALWSANAGFHPSKHSIWRNSVRTFISWCHPVACVHAHRSPLEKPIWCPSSFCLQESFQFICFYQSRP